MRLAWPPPRHLIWSVLIPLAALAIVHLSPASLRGGLSALALVLVFLVPGYLAVLWAYPGKSDLSRRGRAVGILAASVLLSALLGVLLAATPRGLQSASLATLLSLFSIFLFAVSYLRWSDLPRNRRFFLLPRTGLRPGPSSSRAHGRRANGRRAAYAALLLGAVFIAALALFSGAYHISSGDVSSQLNEISPDLEAGKDERLLTLAEDHPQVDLNASISGGEESQIQTASLAVNNSTEEDAPAVNATDMVSSNNTSRLISEDNREIAFFGGGGGSSQAASSNAQGKKAASSQAKEPEDPENALASEDNLTAGEEASNQSITKSQANQTGKEADNSNLSRTSQGNGSLPGALAAAGELPRPEGNESTSSPDGEEIDSMNNTARAERQAAGKEAEEPLANASSDSNQPPVLESLLPDRISPQPPGTAVLWRAKATDNEGDKIFYRFLLNGRETSQWSRVGSWIWLTADLSSGDYQIRVMVRDGNHASESSFDDEINASFVLGALNQPPLLQDLRSDRTSPADIGGRISWTASADDADNDTVYYKFLKNGQDVSAWSTSPFWSWDTASEIAGEYAISVLARDGRHAPEASYDSSMERRFDLRAANANGIPTISEIRADRPSPQPQGSAVTWTAAATDPEGDPISYRFMVDDEAAEEWSSSHTWNWDTSAVQPGDHTIRVLVRDGEHAQSGSFDSSKEEVFSISAANRPPLLASLNPDLSSPQAQGTKVTWTAGAVDPEGDQIFYKFLLSGRDMTGWSESPTWIWSSQGQSLGEHRIRAAIRDGRHAPEGSYDDYKDSTFALISEIDLQIEKLQEK